MTSELFGVRLRPQQADVLAYEGGRLAVSAVPGSGKTLTLALLAARLIVSGRVGDESEVLVVTVQNSAVGNIAERIRDILHAQRLPPVGYKVCTLHKLASDLLRMRYDLAGVEEGVPIVDEAEARRLMHMAADTWVAENRAWWQSLLPADEHGPRPDTLRRWRDETERIGREVTKLCKHLRLRPAEAEALAHGETAADEFVRIGLGLYAHYARYLEARGGLDFDDLIWRAIVAIAQDETFLLHLRRRWPYILEDEAQDSTPLQEAVLHRLAGEAGGWVRVGDPNQSINSTFTAADPRYFRRFQRQADVRALSLLESGRCGAPIIALANHLVAWTCRAHPEPDVRDWAFEPQAILPTGVGDPQRNPPANECRVYFLDTPFPDVAAQADQAADWAAGYIRRYPERSAA
ncbi:MAG: ATP-dependent helicase, partial [Chloroflexota bacterium]